MTTINTMTNMVRQWVGLYQHYTAGARSGRSVAGAYPTADDPSNLMMSERIRSQLVDIESQLAGSARSVQRNAVADTALEETQLLLVQIRGAFSIAANSAAMSDEEVRAQQILVDAAVESIDRIAATTEFNGKRLLDGSEGGFSARAADLGDPAIGRLASVVTGGVHALAGGRYEEAVSVVTAAIDQVSRERGRLAAEQVAELGTQTRWLLQAQTSLSASLPAVRGVLEEVAALMAGGRRIGTGEPAPWKAGAVQATWSPRHMLDLLG
jgi:flagellin-like hook-associated protein FlgL